jgi:hypothetical protein
MTEAQFEALMETMDAKIALARPGGYNDDHLVDREACAVSCARSLLVDEGELVASVLNLASTYEQKMKEAAAGPGEAGMSDLGDKIYKALCKYRMPNTAFADDSDIQYPLKDLMTPDGETVDKGEEAIRDLTDYLVGELSNGHGK